MAADRFYSNGVRRPTHSKYPRSPGSKVERCRRRVSRHMAHQPRKPEAVRNGEQCQQEIKHRKYRRNECMLDIKCFEPQTVMHVNLPSGGHFALPFRPIQHRRQRSPSRDLWDEADGRRIRFAFADSDDVEALRLRRLQAAVMISDECDGTSLLDQRFFKVEVSMDDTHVVDDQTAANVGAGKPVPSDVGLKDLPHSDPSHLTLESLTAAQDCLWPYSIVARPTEIGDTTDTTLSDADDIHEDALPIDHPRRSYDFAACMQMLLQNGRVKLPWLDEESRFRLAIAPNREEITRSQVVETEVDMQGLRWKCMSREAAVDTRKTAHPSRNKTGAILSNRDPIHIERHYQFRAFHPKHRAHFGHYQLRNVLTASNRNEIFYAACNSVMQTSLASPTKRCSVMDLSKADITTSSFRVMCLSTPQRVDFSDYQADSVLIAGGFNGEYAMLDLTSENRTQYIEGYVTQAWNGIVTHVHTHPARRSGSLSGVFCSNDGKLRLMDIKTQRWTGCFDYELSVNCSATAPDARLRLLTADTNATYITNAENGELIAKLEGHNDHSFACAWSPDSRFIATGAQDGKVLVYDTRNWSTPLQALDSVMSCTRSLHFTEDSTLVTAENEDIVSVYDTKNFDDRQDISFFGCIAGVALLDGGSEIAVANADQTVGGLLSFQRLPRGRYGILYGEELIGGSFGYGQADWRRDPWLEPRGSQNPMCIAETFV